MNVLSQAAVFAGNLLLTPVIVRGLGEDGYGVYSLLWVVVSYLNLLGFGTGAAAQRFTAQQPDRAALGRVSPLLRKAVLLTVVLTSLGGLVLFALRNRIAAGVLNLDPAMAPVGSWVLACAAASGPAYCLMQLGISILAGQERFGAFAALSAMQSLAALIIGAALIRLGFGLAEIAGWLVGVWYALAAVSLLLVRGSLLEPGEPPTEARSSEFFSFSFKSFGAQLLWALTYQSDRLLVGSLLTMSQLGFYSLAAGMAQKFNTLCLAVSSAAFPILTQLHGAGEEERLRRFYLKTTELSLFLSLPIAILSFVLAPRFLMIWLGSKFSLVCTWPFRALVVANTVYLLMFIPSAVATGQGAPQFAAYLNLGRILALAVLWPVLIPRFGIVGAALGMLGAEAVVSPIFLWRINRSAMKVGWWEYLKEACYRPAVAGLALAGLGYAVHGYIWGWLGLFATGAAGLALYWAVAYALLDPDARALVERRVRSKLALLARP